MNTLRHSAPIASLTTLAACAVALVTALMPSSAHARLDAQAVRGEPFGVARITLRLPAGDPAGKAPERLVVEETADRVLYPVVATRPAAQFIRGLLEIEGPDTATIYFLFRGGEPLELSLPAVHVERQTVSVRNDPRAYDRLLRQWWRAYFTQARQLRRLGDYPFVMDDYLIGMLIRRLDLRLSLLDQRTLEKWGNDLNVLGVLLGIESLNSAMLPESGRIVVAVPAKDSEARVALPPPLELPEVPLTTAPEVRSPDSPAKSPQPEPTAPTPVEDEPTPVEPGSERSTATAPTPPVSNSKDAAPVASKAGTAEPEAEVIPAPAASQPAVAGTAAPPAKPPQIEVPTIAQHVPAEYGFLRFGNFTNFLWLRDFMDRWGGDLKNMITLRGLDHQMTEKLERQLTLRQSALSKILGPTVIADVAFVLGDPMVQEGASLGVLFQARNNLALAADLKGQRLEAVKVDPQVTEEQIEIAGHQVSLLSSPDNRVRSFYAVDGDFHLVSTSRNMVRRFYEAGRGDRSLSDSPRFHHEFNSLPVDDDPLLVAYFSEAFFRRLLSPTHQIEAGRRHRASQEIQWLQLARLAAAAEGSSAHDVGELVAAGLLPANFNQRPDGSHLLDAEESERVVDSLRGARGTFLPIDDVAVDKMTTAESIGYSSLTDYFKGQWEHFPSIIACLRRQNLDVKQRERLTLDLRATPKPGGPYRWLLEFLGPPTTLQIGPVDGDVASLQISFGLGSVLGNGDKLPHHIFGGLRDFTFPITVANGRIEQPGVRPELIRGYIGAWPKIGLLQALLRPSDVPPDDEGYAPLPEERGWQRSMDPITVFSFKRDVLAEVTPQLRIEEAERPAQVRLRVADLTDTRISQAVAAFGYERARQTSLGGARLMNRLTEQLHVPRPQARKVAERLVDARFVCTLGGDYELTAVNDELALWTSTAVVPKNRFLLAAVPADCEFPLLQWFRGLRAELAVTEGSISAHAEIDMQQ